jgi:hypothetical protein
MLEKRPPSFMQGGGPQSKMVRKLLWGKVPGIDVLRLASNEGEDYAQDLSILFAASGDFRSTVTTVAALPATYKGNLRVVMNDAGFDIVARNLIFLLIAFTVEDRDRAVDCVIHTWYSALVRQSDLDILQGRIRPLLEAVIHENKITEEDADEDPDEDDAPPSQKPGLSATGVSRLY